MDEENIRRPRFQPISSTVSPCLFCHWLNTRLSKAYIYIERCDTSTKTSSLSICGTIGLNPQPERSITNMEITYILAGDYYLSDIALSNLPYASTLGKYSLMHKNYLREYKSTLYAELAFTERLYPLCREVDEMAAHNLPNFFIELIKLFFVPPFKMHQQQRWSLLYHRKKVPLDEQG